MNEEERELETKHEEQLRQAYEFNAYSTPRVDPLEAERIQSESEEEGEQEHLETRCRTDGIESIFVPELYRPRMPLGLSRSADRPIAPRRISPLMILWMKM